MAGKVKSKDAPIVVVKGGGTNHLSDPDPYKDQPPRLHVAINDALTDLPEGAVWHDQVGGSFLHYLPEDKGSSITEIMTWVDERLRQPLTEAWKAQEGPITLWKQNDDDEAWAQALMELLLGVTYAGPGQTYFNDGAWDKYVFSRIQKKTRFVEHTQKLREMKQKDGTKKKVIVDVGEEHVRSWKDTTPNPLNEKAPSDPWIDNDDPAVSIVAACQHLNSYGSITRGFTVEKDLNDAGYTASQACAGLSIVKNGGAFYGTNTHSNADELRTVSVATKENPPLDVGTFYTYNPRGWRADWAAKQDDGSHINMVLRLHPDKDKCQRLDATNSKDLAELKKEGTRDRMFAALPAVGILDSNKTTIFNVGNKYVGMGVPRPTDKAKLKDVIAFIKRARPIGLMRFFITVRNYNEEQDLRGPDAKEGKNVVGPGEVLYASKMLRMYGNGADENFPTSHLLWSLRNTPGLETLQPWWVVLVPCGFAPSHLAKCMWATDARTMKLADYMSHYKKTSLSYSVDYRIATIITNHGTWPAKDCGRAYFWCRSKLDFVDKQNQRFEGYAPPPPILKLIKSLGWDKEYIGLKDTVQVPGHFAEG